MHEFVYELADWCVGVGVKQVVICPGSRSAPLVGAFASDMRFDTYQIVDERSAGYIALGMAQQMHKPVVLICTSGTATVNFYPAIAEAFFQQIPIIVLSADRPDEKLGQQDGQMIFQQQLFGHHVLASFHLKEEFRDPKKWPTTKREIQDILQKTTTPVSGPVHINIPFREPLYQWDGKIKKQTRAFYRKEKNIIPTEHPKPYFYSAWSKAKRRLIIIGNQAPNVALYSVLNEINETGQAIILADVCSNQHAATAFNLFDYILTTTSPQELKNLEPDLIVSMGGHMVSKALKNWLSQIKTATHWRIKTHEEDNVDTYKNVTHFVSYQSDCFLKELISGGRKSQEYYKLWEHQQHKAAAAHNKFFAKAIHSSEVGVVKTILNKLPEAVNLHLANSSSVRYASLVGGGSASVIVNSNRGVSGIDGCTSTALGASLVNNRQTVLITGDLAFLYDRNALWNNYAHRGLKIIVINNGGGGIFQWIEGPQNHKKQLSFFTTPHRVGMEHLCAELNLEYIKATEKTLEKNLEKLFLDASKTSVLEIKTDMLQNATQQRKFMIKNNRI